MNYLAEQGEIDDIIERILKEREEYVWHCPVDATEETDVFQHQTQLTGISKEKEYIISLITGIKEKLDTLQTNIINSSLDDTHSFSIQLAEVDNRVVEINDYANMILNVQNQIGQGQTNISSTQQLLTGDFPWA